MAIPPLDDRIKTLVDAVPGHLRKELQDTLSVLRVASAPTPAMNNMVRLCLLLLDEILACIGEKRPNDSLFACIARASDGSKEDRIEGLGVLERPYRNKLHLIRMWSNAIDHADPTVSPPAIKDAEDALEMYFTVMEWFYCRCANGPRLSCLYRARIVRQPRVLIVDDEAFCIQRYAAALSNDGFQVSCHTDAWQGLRWFLDHAPELDLLVLDYMMPPPKGIPDSETDEGLATGRWFLRQIRDRLEALNLPVIVLTDRSPAVVREGMTGQLNLPRRLVEVCGKSHSPAFQFPKVARRMLTERPVCGL